MAETQLERLQRRALRIANRDQAVKERSDNLASLIQDLAAATAERDRAQTKIDRITGQITQTQAALQQALDRLETAISTDENPPPGP